MTADTVGGVWTYALELIDALAGRGFEVELATMGRPLSAHQRAELRRTAVAGLHESSFALEWMDDAWDDVDRAGEWLLDLEDRLQPHVVHLNGYAHAALPWRMPPVVVAHSDVVSWWEAVRAAPPPPEWDEYRRRVRSGLQAAGAVVAPTMAMLAALQRGYDVAGGVVVANGRRSTVVAPGAKEPLVLGTGRLWDEAKNLAALAGVADRLSWPVALAGEGDSPSGAELLGFLPFDRLRWWLARASIYCAPARYEPFGLGALEAGLAGCALVVGDIPSLHEVWGEAAAYVDPEDPAALVGALESLICDPRRRAALGRRARARAAEYTPEQMADGYVQVYRSVHAGAPA